MMHRLGVLLLSAVFATAPLFSQSLAAPQNAAAVADDVYPLLLRNLADHAGSQWYPSWPADFPPDAFSVKEADARSITLRVEPASGAEIAVRSALVRWDSRGSVLEFPFAGGGEFTQVAVRRSSSGRVSGIDVASLSITFKYVEEDRPESALVNGEAGLSYAAFSFRTADGETDLSATETRSGEDGLVTAVLDYVFMRDRIAGIGNRTEAGVRISLLNIDYDSAGRIVAFERPDFRSEALYGRDGKVAYWRTADSTGISIAERRFQWDERGFLVRESVSEAGPRFELRYEYVTDARGNWVERRVTRWVERFGSLVGEEGPTTRRTIRYR